MDDTKIRAGRCYVARPISGVGDEMMVAVDRVSPHVIGATVASGTGIGLPIYFNPRTLVEVNPVPGRLRLDFLKSFVSSTNFFVGQIYRTAKANQVMILGYSGDRRHISGWIFTNAFFGGQPTLIDPAGNLLNFEKDRIVGVWEDNPRAEVIHDEED
jgi:hypothetical protein